ncbi:hypothetical protein GC098_35765 [Paenibacillus sp. LMG 31458]|uniref:alpha-L-fucosidase n=1 Tax=Paenibacillus phytorum TaxID=2654977 RepID=A0ABX1Y8B1_9BACL|nr:hypothetical protein [Paenibacillus phytorum]
MDWEKCFTIAYHWSYDAEERVLPFEQKIKLMIDCFVRGGNVLLNVAPDPEGEIPASQVERLKQIGAFMRKNGEAIYGTQGGAARAGRPYLWYDLQGKPSIFACSKYASF